MAKTLRLLLAAAMAAPPPAWAAGNRRVVSPPRINLAAAPLNAAALPSLSPTAFSAQAIRVPAIPTAPAASARWTRSELRDMFKAGALEYGLQDEGKQDIGELKAVFRRRFR